MPDPEIESVTVDEGEVLLLQAAAWNRLRETPIIDGIPLALPDLTWSLLTRVQRFSELRLGLCKSGVKDKCWLPCVLLKTNVGWQRVHLERLTCESCHWQGETANPMVIDLYLCDGTRDWRSALASASKHPVCHCPKCGEKLPRHPIWVEAINA
jgi:hypothetical protein